MGRPLLSINLFSLTFCVSLSMGCIQKDDTGKVCGTPLNRLANSPIIGENPIQETIRLQRDKECLSFHCLEHRGLPSYCTRECSQTKSAESLSPCSSNEDCPRTNYCSSGECISDDCSAGYRCQQIQQTGPLQDRTFCVRQESCSVNSDCDALGSVDCVAYGCFNECLLNPDCLGNQYICLPKAELPCACREEAIDEAGNCSDADFVCESGETSTIWPIGSVSQQGICTTR